MADPDKSPLVAKAAESPNEVKILDYLRGIQPQCPHVISLTEASLTPLGPVAILPKVHSIHDQLAFDNGRIFCNKIVQLCWELIEGVAFLHEHRVAHMDIEPENLAYDDAFSLQIIDFDVAVQADDEEAMVVGYRGTKGWAAPEVGEEDGPALFFRPIVADRWSCGQVIERFLRMGEQDQRLWTIADRLKAIESDQRPSLLGWSKWLDVPLTGLASALESGKVERREVIRPREDMAEVASERMRPPKKPRLATRLEFKLRLNA